MPSMTLVKPNLHRVDVDARQMLFHIPSSSLFELDALSRDLLALFDRHGRVTPQVVAAELAGRYPDDEIAGLIAEFKSLEIIAEAGAVARINPAVAQVRKFPLTTIVLNVNTGCNLSCTYCYKEDLATPSKGERMAVETAIKRPRSSRSSCCCANRPTSRTTTWCSSAANRCRT